MAKNSRKCNKREEWEFEIPSEIKNYLQNNTHTKQMVFHADTASNRWIFGGNRTGKTQCGAMEAVLWALCIHPHRNLRNATEGWVVSLSTRFGRDVAQRKILKYLNDKSKDNKVIKEVVMLKGSKDYPERGVIDYMLIKNQFGTDSKISFKSCDQGREKFQGEGLDWVWFDEEPPEDIYEECLLRTLDKAGSAIWGTMTPLKGKSWVYERIFLKSNQSTITKAESDDDSCHKNYDISVMFMSWEDNPYLPKSEIKRMQKALSASALESRKYGRFMDGTGLVFCEFGDENIVDPFEIPATWFRVISIDPGFTNPCAVIWVVACPDDNIFVVWDYSVAEQTVPHHAREIKKINEQLDFENKAIIDSAALSKTLGSAQSVVEQFEQCGISVDTKVNKEVFGGIMKVKGLFLDANGIRKLFVFRNCTNLIRELRTYWWGDNEKPVKKDDHCIDALRYFVSTSYQNAKSYASMSHTAQKKQSDISANKKRLIREAQGR